MLEGLCGNRNVQKILLFLFVNTKCYGAQLQRLLRTPLTSLQNALGRLERGRIVQSYFEGKTKIYQLNPAYPLLAELELLLKKTYTLLSPQEKKLYSLYQLDLSERRVQEPILQSFWEKLKTIRQMTIHAKSRSKEGWNGKGRGEVQVVKESETALVFQERGSWLMPQEQQIAFSNVFRWSYDRMAMTISLEHLRLGPNSPVFLFHLAPTGNQILASLESHLCGEDAYLAQVLWDAHSIRLKWRVIGPKKNEEMDYYYF
jgi:hypothetical protein